MKNQVTPRYLTVVREYTEAERRAVKKSHIEDAKVALELAKKELQEAKAMKIPKSHVQQITVYPDSPHYDDAAIKMDPSLWAGDWKWNSFGT